MQIPYQLLVDTWEGQLEIDEGLLYTNGVRGMLVRLNDMNGGHHKDLGFDKQWSEYPALMKAPYFVYNPWVSGSANYSWLAANMPVNAKAVMIDAEVIKTGYPATTYGSEFNIFMSLVRKVWNVAIYTGQWFLPYLTPWPTTDVYWWAAYPSSFYPPTVTPMTWDEVRTNLIPLDLPFNASKCPGTIKFWQFSGDKIIVPGSAKPIDLNVFYGSEVDLANFFGVAAPTPPPNPSYSVTVTLTHEGYKTGTATILMESQ